MNPDKSHGPHPSHPKPTNGDEIEPGLKDYPASLHAAIAGARALSRQERLAVYVYHSVGGAYVLSLLESTAKRACDDDGYLIVTSEAGGGVFVETRAKGTE